MRKLTVSLIIPFQKWNDYLVETLDQIEKLDYPNFDVFLLPDGPLEKDELSFIRAKPYVVHVKSTGPVSPAIKRDQGVSASSSDIVAFIDDDAYPEADWLNEALKGFENSSICAVGGPQVTPESDSFWQKVSGATFLSALNGGLVSRYWPDLKAAREVDDWPSVNLLVRREDFLKVGGFDSSYWPGEDTKLCRDLVHQLGKRIAYSPTAIVHHHRRSGYFKHLKQIGNYALHRGFFAKKFPETSFRPIYLVPSLFFLFIVIGSILSVLFPVVLPVFFLGNFLYFLALVFSTLSIWNKVKNFRIALATVPYIFSTHIWYGIRFLFGMIVVRNLNSRLGR